MYGDIDAETVMHGGIVTEAYLSLGCNHGKQASNEARNVVNIKQEKIQLLRELDDKEVVFISIGYFLF